MAAEYDGSRSKCTPLTHIAVGVWGLCSWILLNALWGQLPYFVRVLPEGNQLAVQLLAAEQAAYVFPLACMYRRRLLHYRRASQEFDIWLLLLSGFVLTFLLSEFWDITIPCLGCHDTGHSIALLSLAFFAGAVSSSTGIVFTPYLASLPTTYTSAHALGASLSGPVVAVLVLVTNPSSLHPRISVKHYFLIISCVFASAILAFLHIRTTVAHSIPSPIPSAYHAFPADVESEGLAVGAVSPSSTSEVPEPEEHDPAMGHVNSPAYTTSQPFGSSPRAQESYGSLGTITAAPTSQLTAEDAPFVSPPVALATSPPPLRRAVWHILSLQCLLASLAFGIVPSILPLATAGYQQSSRVLMLTTVGHMIADPLGKLTTTFLYTKYVFASGLMAIACASVLLACAVMKEQPWLFRYHYGGLVPIVANTLFGFGAAFTCLSIYFSQRYKEPDEARKYYTYCGLATQTGAFIGVCLTLIAILVFSR